MGIYPNVTQQDLINLRKLAEEQKNQRPIKIKNRILKETHDKKLAENLAPVTKKLEEVFESTEKVGEVLMKLDADDGETQTPDIQIIIDIQSLRDTLALMKRSKFFFQISRKDNGYAFWEGVHIEPLGEKRIINKVEGYDINPNNKAHFTNPKLTTKPMDNEDKITVFIIFAKIGF